MGSIGILGICWIQGLWMLGLSEPGISEIFWGQNLFDLRSPWVGKCQPGICWIWEQPKLESAGAGTSWVWDLLGLELQGWDHLDLGSIGTGINWHWDLLGSTICWTWGSHSVKILGWNPLGPGSIGAEICWDQEMQSQDKLGLGSIASGISGG
ncbi:hypothetical protein DUI87_22426 [Hirundo rustica rustica]|uniref:Uncharacterized protein n=1 Tax=Hirundo rustica rustica TaxID=333673 RepID=A0A3M0JIK9_HIRRU|nr:hypothetical protein DUI87_22426 [Hirundo rustica rustica]